MLKASGILVALAVWSAMFLLSILNGVAFPKAEQLIINSGVSYRAPYTEPVFAVLGKPFGPLASGLAGGLAVFAASVLLLFLPRVSEKVVLLCLSIFLSILMYLVAGITTVVVFRLVKVAANI